ncbi:uncharacterized protein LOC120357307 [Solenopsis invicta]|uniref:uncharacterized protein LOC120357301 n=1 Tax=Solenopsis invicta TaxID=13686 RepID=UPI00193DB3EA|nr:uncharacterized protein LOC120357301 [Solenopsis invicta]XP_039303399.1 uncharacterized protein LOC120357303 [Solenopsis invicta]XP_039303400.1 uncharacterized protein LOC120357304 [Solenopsis invicta]XP_039303401.1 uncharacterized protein LOC120357305 [Solenopsis invicta]XP_039303402.1 uncharacterized protein LOC120357306 [Solenopsis invicta]XP_039303403.1 uncharacterized protein LOC120357307 [Solenopsis invicta]
MNINTVDIEALNIRLNKLDEHHRTLTDTLIEIAAIDEEISDEQVDAEMSVCEDKYIELKVLGDRVMKDRVRPAGVSNHIEQATVSVNPPSNRVNDNFVRLPKIDLPTFSGSYEDWHPYFDTFNSLIHSNASLRNIQKFHYLKSSLKGDAAETIASIEISDVNYNDAWSRLRERYENERIAVQNHIKSIFELPVLRRENGNVLRNILDGLLKHTRALRALGRPTDQWDDILIHIVTSKLDFITIKEWENTLQPRELPTIQEFIEFLTKRCQTLEAVARRTFLGNQNVNLKQNSNVKVIASHAAVSDVKCAQCKGDHQIYHCQIFKELPIAERLNKVKSLKLCLNCLRSKHMIKDCTASHYRICSKKHSTLLHEDRGPARENRNEAGNKETKTESDSNKPSSSVCASSHSRKCKGESLLSTAIIKVKNNGGNYIEGRALLDSGSQSNFITREFFKRLNLKSTDDKVKINGVNEGVSSATKSVNIKIASRFGTFGTELECIILKQITPMLPTSECDTIKLSIPENIRLADPSFHVTGQIDILIGTDIFWDLFCIGQIKLGKNMPTLQKSLFGWVVAGPTQINNIRKSRQINCNLSTIDQINETIHKFWEVEAYESNDKTCLDQEEKYCENFFKETYSRHMRRKSTTKEGAIQVFLPHHAVFKESSTTTKTRVVFDASSKGARDISKMYRQIFVHEDQTALQSILWREDPTTDIEEYELLTITYGTKPASFLAVRCLHQLAELEKEKFPKAAEVVLKDFYMDDLLTGGNSIEEVKELKNQLIGLLAKGGFELHKWNTNVVDTKEKDPNKNKSVNLHKLEESKLLGIRWNPSSDAFHYEVESRDEKRTTKRTMLSQICKLFDPLGLVGPIITLAKILMQKLWSLGLDWDESVPMSIYKEWHQLKSQLNLLNRLKIPRAIMTGNTGTRIQLHGFCDASEKAYGACVYIREQIASDKIGIALVCSKSRVAPMKTLSLPRLELCGAVLLANLMKRVLDSLNIKISQRYFWCDSKIVITWIRSSSRKWQTFVANRASEIQSISSPSEWHHIKSKENPADLISRGETSEHLINTKLWWQGPTWLQANEETWPMEGEELLLTNAPEMRKQAVIAITTKEEPVLDYNRHSTLVKLINIVAYMLRFIENTKCKNENKEAKLGKITLQEKRKAKLKLIKLIQTEEYNEELNALQAKNKVSLKSKLKTLHPFLDDEGVIRVGGRLQQASLPERTKHPIVIPAAHRFTTLVINHYHEKLLHAGAQTTLYAIREEFWPIQARNKIKKIIRQCVKCRKANPMVGWQLMGQLPSVRVNVGRPFLSSGVDYCGPFQVRDSHSAYRKG